MRISLAGVNPSGSTVDASSSHTLRASVPMSTMYTRDDVSLPSSGADGLPMTDSGPLRSRHGHTQMGYTPMSSVASFSAASMSLQQTN